MYVNSWIDASFNLFFFSFFSLLFFWGGGGGRGGGMPGIGHSLFAFGFDVLFFCSF